MHSPKIGVYTNRILGGSKGVAVNQNRNRIVALALIGLVTIFLLWSGDAPEQSLELPQAPPQAYHTVRTGDWLKSIAPRYHNVGWEDILLANEDFLQSQYEEVCSQFGERYRNNARRRGLFCNDRYRRPYGNTLMPGWTLSIPSGTAPPQIMDVMSRASGRTVGLVIDDTGSMENDVIRVSHFYSSALREHGKQLIGVWLYADGAVRHYDQGFVKFHTTGGEENTFSALKMAAEADLDFLVLVTDEPGDDWDWPVWWRPFDQFGFPPVVAHCIPDDGYPSCRENLQRLVEEVGGEYVEGI